MVDRQVRPDSVSVFGWRRLASATTAWCCWLYVAAMLGLWLMIRLAADRWWPATLVIFGPRWIWALPLAGLVLAALAFRRRALITLGIGAILLVGPVMGFCLPWDKWLVKTASGTRVRVLTCNVENVDLNAHALRGVMDDVQPDVVAFQEWSDQHGDILFGPRDWHVQVGKGLCLGSRYRIAKVEPHPDEHGWRDVGVRYDLETPAGTLHFVNLHLSTPRYGIEAMLTRGLKGIHDLQTNTAQRAHESEEMSRWVSRFDGHRVIAGDFNMPSESLVYRQAWGVYTDAFAAAGLGVGHTKFTRWYGIRIDHILVGAGWRCRRCWVGPPVGSDHRPVIADLEWVESSR